MTLATTLADLPLDERESLLASMTDEDIEALLYDWPSWARPEQLTPEGNWRIWLVMAGRGWGKTRVGAEDVKSYGLEHPNSRIGIVAPTFADARDTCIEGESGLLHVLPKGTIDKWNRSLGELILRNGTRYKLFSADEPERLRGPQHHRMWFDELGAWKYAQQTYDMAMFGLRLGMNPQAVITTTPRPIGLVKDLLKRAGLDVVLTKRSTYDNLDNLAPAFLQQIVARYEGTRLGRQELDADILDDVPGALWNRAEIDALRVPQSEVPQLTRIVVSVDPSATGNPDSDEAGIIVAGVGANGRGYVLDDYSLQGSPHVWATAAVDGYRRHTADRIVAETNNGGEMVELTIRTVDPNVAYRAVHASRGKLTRAEPVAALYEQSRVHHVGVLPRLEDEMVTWTPGDKSPNRMDALVWALTDLMIDGAGDDWRIT